MIQISSPSRTRVPEYIAQKQEVDRLVGEINGRYSEEDWTPVRHLYRSYTQEELAAFYRQADVCLVTPLRDGMNLVAKEYIACQTDNPGVLLLSQFCGTAEDLREAVIVNPYDIDGTATALNRALNMDLEERRERWQALNERVHARTAQTWRARFLADLEKGGSQPSSAPKPKPKASPAKAKAAKKKTK
jgi:trehalose-6-phosphate synthase